MLNNLENISVEPKNEYVHILAHCALLLYLKEKVSNVRKTEGKTSTSVESTNAYVPKRERKTTFKKTSLEISKFITSYNVALVLFCVYKYW